MRFASGTFRRTRGRGRPDRAMRQACRSLSADFTAVARAEIAEAMLEPTLKVEAEIGLSEATLALAREIARLAPYGQGNPTPVLACRGVKIVDCRTSGRITNT